MCTQLYITVLNLVPVQLYLTVLNVVPVPQAVQLLEDLLNFKNLAQCIQDDCRLEDEKCHKP
eukprot:SAG31_NODE_1159_length_9603_cov_8.927715_9_plen_62_part_00